MRAELVLRHPGAKGVDGQRILASQQFEIGGMHREVKDPLLRTYTATTLRQAIQIHLGAEPYLAAMATSFPGFKHFVTPCDNAHLLSQIGRPPSILTGLCLRPVLALQMMN
jgi:hypothetical protein